MTMKFQTNTEIAPIIDVCTYWGPFDYDSMWDYERQNYEDDGQLVCDDFDHAAYKDAIVAEANRVFEKHRLLFAEDLDIISIKATSMFSPREYNFRGDSLDLEVEVNSDFFAKAKTLLLHPANETIVDEYIKDHWHSRDGFISFMPIQNRDGLYEVLERAISTGTFEDECRGFGSILALMWHLTESKDYGLTDCLCEGISGNHSLSEFCTVLDPEECLRLYPEAARFKADLDEMESRLEKQYQQYLCAQIPGNDASCRKAQNYRNGVNAIIGRTWSDVQNCIRWNHTDRGSDEDKALARERVKAGIEELREEWDLECERGWKELWR